MGRIKSAAMKLKEANLAKAREEHLAKPKTEVNTSVRPRKTKNRVYASYLLRNGTAQQLLELPTSEKAVEFFGLDKLGMKELDQVTDAVLSKPREFHPAMVKAMVGATTPTAKKSAWGSRVIKYSAATEGNAQSHYQAPICAFGAAVNFDGIDVRATACFKAKESSLGGDYGRFSFSPEYITFQKT